MRKIMFLIGLAVLSLPLFMGNPVESGHIKGEEILMLDMAPTASLTDSGTLYNDSKLFVSQVYESKSAFQLLGINWTEALPKGTEAGIEIRFRALNGEWSNWQKIVADADSPDGLAENTLWSYTVTNESNAFQYRVALSTENASITPKISQVSFDYVDGGETPTITKLQKLIFGKDESVVGRDDWGADESLRLAKSYNIDSNDDFESELDDSEVSSDPDMKIVKTVTKDGSGNSLLWPLEYPAEIKKIIIHHTASSNDSLSDEESVIRAIYYYHAVTRGWGDIGYNYIVGPSGTVYEGRAGGEGVVGGHASGFNTGSIGISLLGNYEEVPVPAKMMQGLMGLIYEKADLYNIDPNGESEFRGEDLANILGHKDVGSTACPGKYTYEALDDIRNMVDLALNDNRHTNTKTTYSYEEVGNRELVSIDPNGNATVKIKIKNTGTKTWDKNTFLTVNANYSADSIVEIPKDSKKRTAVMNETSVATGKVATFSFTVSAGMIGGLASFDMAPVFNGTEKTTNTMDLGFYVEPPSMKFESLSTTAPSTLKPGESYKVTVKLKNNSGFDWAKSGDYPVKLVATSSSSLVSKTTLAEMSESSVKNGGTATFVFTIKAPVTAGTYSLYFAPQMENSNAVASSSAQLSVKVAETTEDAIISSGSTDLTFTSGESKMLWLSIKNTSSKSWTTTGTSPFKLVFSKPTGLSATFNKLSVQKVASGVSAKMYLTVTAPTESGTYTLKILPRLGNTNLIKNPYTLTITVEEEEDLAVTEYTDPIRVKLTPSNGVGTPVISADTKFGVYDDDSLLKTFSASSRVRVTAQSSGKFKITSGSMAWEATGPVRFIPEADGIMQVLTMDERPAWDTSLNDNQFRGTIEVAFVDGETVLINELPIEDYLKGIGEVSNGDPIEKVKTIIVLARTYATYYTNGEAEKFPGKPYNLDDDPNSSQKYLGYGFEARSSNVAEAVEETEGMVVTYNGQVVITPYFSESDGVATKNAKDVWGWTNTPWLVSVPDTYCESSAFSGHGVGLSGCGATVMAEMGETFEDIIKYYYTGVKVEKL